MSPCNVTLARHLEQLQLRAEYLRQQEPWRVRPPARPALLVVGDGVGVPLVVSVRIAARGAEARGEPRA
jgi:hypothetical protein